MASAEAVGSIVLEQTITKEVARWNSGGLSDSDKAILLAQLVVLLGQCEPGPLPEPLSDLAPSLVPLLQPGTDVHIQRNAAALLTSLVGTDEDSWKRLVLNENTLVPSTVELLRRGLTSAEGGQDDATCINMLAALTAAARGGEEGAQSVINAEALPLVATVLQSDVTSEQLQEAGADLVCQLGTYETCRPVLVEQGCVAALASGLALAKNNEVRVRALMGLGMLLPSSPAAQLQLAQSPTGVKALMVAMQQPDDRDTAQLAMTLFRALAQNPSCKLHVEAALRAAVEAAPPSNA